MLYPIWIVKLKGSNGKSYGEGWTDSLVHYHIGNYVKCNDHWWNVIGLEIHKRLIVTLIVRRLTSPRRLRNQVYGRRRKER